MAKTRFFSVPLTEQGYPEKNISPCLIEQNGDSFSVKGLVLLKENPSEGEISLLKTAGVEVYMFEINGVPTLFKAN